MTRLQITNAALAKIGEPPIATIDDTHPRALRAAAIWQTTLEGFLREHPWNFAKTRATLEPESPQPIFEWTQRYALPDDLITLVQVNGVACGPTKVGVDYEIEGRTLLCNFATGDIQYIYLPTADSELDTFLSIFDPLAVRALITLLASELANPLARDSAELGQRMKQQYEGIDLPRARTKNAQEAKLPTYPGAIDSRSIRSRSVWGSGGVLPGITDL